jgi:low temperature requirement protein LtrA
MSSTETSLDEHPVTPLELFFDPRFVFAIAANNRLTGLCRR